jgi:hypothetical protein
MGEPDLSLGITWVAVVHEMLEARLQDRSPVASPEPRVMSEDCGVAHCSLAKQQESQRPLARCDCLSHVEPLCRVTGETWQCWVWVFRRHLE